MFELEREQTQLDGEDFIGDLTAKHYSRNWAALTSHDDPRCIEMRELIAVSKHKIKEYRRS